MAVRTRCGKSGRVEALRNVGSTGEGQEQWFATKPASGKVKVRPLKKLKDAAL